MKDPAHLGAFVFAYARKTMNQYLEIIDGFTDWNKTFAYTDTDCYHLHNDQYKELQEKMPNIIGKDMGQFHDDIDEVKDGKVIRAIWLDPKTYNLEVIGKEIDEDGNETGRIIITNHLRAKGVPKEDRKKSYF